MNLSSNIRVSVEFQKPVVFAGEDVECVITFKNTSNSSPNQSYSPVTPRQLNRRSLSGAFTRASSASVGPPPVPITGSVTSSSSFTSDSVAKKHGRSVSIISLTSDLQIDDALKQNTSFAERPAKPHHIRTKSLQHALDHTPNPYSFTSPSKKSASPTTPAPAPVRKSSIKSTLASRSKRSQSLRPASTPKSTPVATQTTSDTPTSPKLAPFPRHSALDAVDKIHKDSSSYSLSNDSEPSISGTPRSSFDMYSMSNLSDETQMSEYPLQPVVRQSVRKTARTTPSLANGRHLQAGPEKLMIGYAQLTGSLTVDDRIVNHAHFIEVKQKGSLGSGGGVVGMKKGRPSGLFSAFGLSNIGESIGELLGTNAPSSMREMQSNARSRSIPIIVAPPSILFVNLELKPGDSERYCFKFTLPKNLPPSHKATEFGADVGSGLHADTDVERDKTMIRISYNIRIRVQRPGESKHKLHSVKIPFRVLSVLNDRGDHVEYNLFKPHEVSNQARITTVKDMAVSSDAEPESDKPSFLKYVQELFERQASASALLSSTTPQSSRLRRLSSIGEALTPKQAIDSAIHNSYKKAPNFGMVLSSHMAGSVLLQRNAYRLGESINVVIDFTLIPNADAIDSIPVYELIVSLVSYDTVSRSIACKEAVLESERASRHEPASLLQTLVPLQPLQSSSQNNNSAQQQQQHIVLWNTRKVHVQFSESVHFARRATFALPIPLNATPEYSTSGLRLKWLVRIDLVASKLPADPQQQQQHSSANGTSTDEIVEVNGQAKENDLLNETDGIGDSDGSNKNNSGMWNHLLKEVTSDDKGRILQGVERFPVQMYTNSIPIHVYGVSTGAKSENDAIDLPI